MTNGSRHQRYRILVDAAAVTKRWRPPLRAAFQTFVLETLPPAWVGLCGESSSEVAAHGRALARWFQAEVEPGALIAGPQRRGPGPGSEAEPSIAVPGASRGPSLRPGDPRLARLAQLAKMVGFDAAEALTNVEAQLFRDPGSRR